MTRVNEKARMLLGACANAPMRMEELTKERAWAERRRDENPDGGVGEAWRALVNEIDEELMRCARLRATVDALIDALGEPRASVIRLRYVEKKSYAAIARTLSYSVDHVRRLKSQADRAIGRAMGSGGE